MKAFIFYRNWRKLQPMNGVKIGLETPEFYDHVATYPHIIDREEMDQIYADMNHEGTRKFDKLPRSMSVGDLIVYEDLDVRLCAGIGWEARPDLHEWARSLIHTRSRSSCDICWEVVPLYNAGSCKPCDRWLQEVYDQEE